MRKVIENKYFLLALRMLIGFIFIYAAITKISAPDNFAQSVSNYKLLPMALVNIVAIFLPWLELIAGILLIFGIAVRENSFLVDLMLLIFVAAIIISLFRGLDINCGCFGTTDGAKIGIQKVLENIGLITAATILMIKNSTYFSLQINTVE